MFERLKLDETSVINTKKSINKKSINQKSLKMSVKESELKKIPFYEIKKNLEDCYEDFDTLFDD